MKKIWMAGIGGAVAGAVISTQFAGPLVAQEAEKESSVYEQLDLFGDIFERIRGSYVEPVDEKELIASAINGMLSHLDPHSSYLPPDDFDDMQVQTKGEFGGLGIEVTQENGVVKVVAPIEGTPADRAGVQPGDLIVQVNGESVVGLTLNEAVDLMRGPVGSDITITLQREGTEEPFDVKITRETITVSPVEARLEDGVVILRLKTFNEQTFPELEEQLKREVEAAGGMDKVTGFVIDLRNNPGGLLNQAISVVDAFLDSGEIVSTRGRDPRDSERYNATPGDLTERQAARRRHQRRLGLRVRDRRGRAQGPPPRGHHRHPELRQGLGADDHAGAGRGRDPADHGALLHAVRPLDPGARRLARHHRRAAPARGGQGGRAGPAPQLRSEADLRGSLENDSLTEDEKKILEEDTQPQGGDRATARRGLPAQLRDGYPARHVLPLGGERAPMPKCMTEADILALPYRPNVGLMILNPAGRVFAGQRLDNPGPAWQMPQGGIDAGEDPARGRLPRARRGDRHPADGGRAPRRGAGLDHLRPAARPRAAHLEGPLPRPAPALVPDALHRRRRPDRHRSPTPSSAPGTGSSPRLVDLIVPFKRETYAAVMAAFRDRLR